VRNRQGRKLTGFGAGLVLLLAACGSDDGTRVRTADGTQAPNGASGTGSGTASGTGSGSGTASGTGSGTASGTATVPCDPVGDPKTADTTVAVELLDQAILLDPAQVQAGTITFEAGNNGTKPHQLVIARAEDPAKLPLAANGAVNEAKLPKGAFIGKVKPFSPELTCTGTFKLSAGSYTLFCNILETEADGTKDSHYANGMRTSFKVRT
jgi:hypothetical protein